MRWYQYSLRSLLIATAVTCATLGINTQVPYYLKPNSLLYGDCASEIGYGFPWIYSSTVSGFLVQREQHFHWLGLSGDIAAWLAVILVAIWVVEWTIAKIRPATRS